MPTPRPTPQKNRRSGFALLITITLLAFLVLLLVSLAALTRVETQVASNNQQLSQARQNALMALNIALGKLQANAGPDQRVTATADLDPAAVVTNRRWTGVWDSNPASPTYRQRLSWLVSGAAPNVATAVPDPGLDGVSETVVRLVGAHTVNLEDQATSDRNRIDVPLEEIRSEVVPGLGTAPGGHLVGHFGYWVADEGVKARVSLSDPWNDPSQELITATNVSETDAETFSFFGAQRSGIEGVSASGDDMALADKIEAAYPLSTNETFRAALPKVLSLSQLPLSPTPDSTKLNTAIKNRFHDLTASSRSVLADVSVGGLKRDLTAWAATPAGPTNLPLDSDFILHPSYSLPVDPTEHYGLPKWGIIRSYLNGVMADGTAKSPVAQTDQQQSLYPVMTFGRLGLAVSCEGEGAPLKLHLFPHLVLWNPTNVPITGEFDFCIGFPWNPSAFFKFDHAKTGTLKLRVYMGSASLTGPTTSRSLPHEYFRFRLRTPATGIAAGQSLAFTLSSDGTYLSGSNLMEANNPIATDNSVTINGQTMSAAELERSIYFDYHSGVMGMLLCPRTVGSTPTSEDLLANAYQALHVGDGFGGAGTAVPSGRAQPAASVLEPIMDYRLAMNFSRRRSSTETPRWLANLNPRSGLLLRRRSFYSITTAPPFNRPPTVSGNENSAADGVDPAVSGGVVVKPVLFEFPAPNVPLFSVAQLQHASLSLINLNPTYAVGNAIPDVYVPLDQTSFLIGADPGTNPDSLRRVYDLSHVLNEALWDRYFFSTVPATLTNASQLTADYRLPNSRHEPYWRGATPTTSEFGELKTPDGAAAHLLVNGGFNINSTSVQAWRALLYSHNTRETFPAAVPFSRFARPLSGATPNSTWTGYRVLTDTQIDHLAANIVKQVKARGPFLSLADFVNRRLVDVATTAAEDERLRGTLQAALDFDPSPYTNAANLVTPFTAADAAYRVSSYMSGATPEQRLRYLGGPDAAAPYASMAAFAPGFLTQADLLNALGPLLTARSDTFRIRAYGDVVNPVTGGPPLECRAWCEAIVQRLPDYVSDTDNPTVAPGAANSTNQTFGRRFKIVSFQWLSTNDI
jgi:hypothetical protein